VVADEQDGAAGPGDIRRFAEALLLKRVIADGEHFVDHQNLLVQMRGDGEGKAHIHTGGVALYRRIDEFFDLRKGDDLVETLIDLLLSHAEDRAVQINIFPPAELLVEARADFEQGRGAATDNRPPLRRRGDLGEYLQQRRLSASVLSDESHDLARLDRKGDAV